VTIDLRTHALLVAAVYAGVATVAQDAGAAPPWVDRHLTLPSGDWAFDVGLGVARERIGPEDAAAGVNAEMAVGVTSRVQIGVRTGIRFGDSFARAMRADQFGRLFDRQTFGGGAEVLANPELLVRGALVRGAVAELALEGRIVLPFENGTNAGLMFGVPLSFNLGERVRLDTGAYVPVVFEHPTTAFAVSLPLDVWIQASPRVWLGPMTGIVVQQPGDARSQASVSLGFGFGYQITHYLDFKAMVLFPTLNGDTRFFGVGAGVEIRIE
jgi:hypothetical protein